MIETNLHKISGEGFLSFYDPFNFSISGYQNQTVQIDGKNRDDLMSQSNGSGKSGLLEALSWVLYGELCRKNRYKDEIIYNRNGVKAKEAWVKAELSQSGNVYQIERSIGWKKSPELNLMINDEPIPVLKGTTYGTKQQYLEDVLGMNFVAFQCCEMFGRDFMSFPDLKPADRAKILTDIRGLDKYVSAVKRCNDEIDRLQTSIDNLQDNLHTIDGRITQLRAMDYKKQIEQFEADRTNQLIHLEYERQSFQALLNKLQETNHFKIKSLQSQITNYTTEKEKNDQQLLLLPTIQAERIELEKQLTQAQTNNANFSQQLKDLNQELIQLQKLGVGRCPFCHQPITAEHIADEMILYDKKSDEFNQKIKVLNNKIIEIGKTLTVKREDVKHLDNTQSANKEYQRLIEQARLQILDLQRNPEELRIQSILNNLIKQQETIVNAIDPYKKQEEDRKATLFDLVGQTKTKKQEIEKLEIDSKYYLFWAEGFKKIRMMLFGTMIDRLQNYAQTLLSQYSSELQIQFSTIRETRSGTTKDEFDISITDTSGTTLSYEMYSGGEKQKIRLSIALALSQMIKDDCGREFNWVAFDEPNDSLDDVGKEVNFEVFSKLAEEGKTVLVTDHDSMFKDKFDKTILVVKENDKSSIS